VIGNGGEVFVLDMGKPVKIRHLAEQMIRLAGREPNREIPIHYIGLRPGEKLYEELFYDMEELAPTVHPKIRMARRRQVDPTRIDCVLTAMQTALATGDETALLAGMHQLVPQWQTAPELGSASPLHVTPGAPAPSPELTREEIDV
jgi:FlaA1/EpsC-like NDP-sugar epimerase